MALSANTLIHFTSDKASLKGILEDNFQVFNCREEIVLGGHRSALYLPMVSFCDIPLSEVKDHITKYGSYGIGMTKEWGMGQGLNPVLYIAPNSKLSESYRFAFNSFTGVGGGGTYSWSEEQRALADVVRYIKNYEGDLTRKGNTIKNYRFSDEREWRYVPPHRTDCEMVMDASWYSDATNQAAADAKLKPLRLKFTPNDIRYIIIKDDSEIADFVAHLRVAKGTIYSYHDVERLTTRILTAEQIHGDM